MIKVQKQQDILAAQQNSPSVSVAIRAATASELTKYEKNKLASIEDNAQQNKIEVIEVNGTRLKSDPDTKTVNINVGDLAFKSAVSPTEIDNNELFFIKCSLD